MVTFIGQTIQFGWPAGLPFILLYAGGLVFVAAFSTLTLSAEDARQQSERLLLELQAAHQQLQEYAGQAEELAVAQERNRLARDLHDSVAQTLYGLTLQSEAASRKLTAGDLTAVEDYLLAMRQSAQQTLQETRLLIYELRPPILGKEGLATVYTHVSNILAKLHLASRTQAALYALREGYASLFEVPRDDFETEPPPV